MWLVVGLGNPGPRYAQNRHNVGFMVVDALARRHNVAGFRDKFGGQIATALVNGNKVWFLKPMEYMNVSGFALQRASNFYGVDSENTIVVHDEIDLEFARLRLKKGGGHGGHNGLRSIVEQTGSKDFLRVRVGVDKPPGAKNAGEKRVAGYVLSNFPSDQAAELDALIDRAADSVEAIIAGGIRKAMNDFNAAASNTAPNGGAAKKVSDSES